ERRHPGAPASAGRLVHLPEHESRAVDHARGSHVEPEVVPFARTLADPGEDGETLVVLERRPDEFHEEDRLADAGAAEEPGLPAARERREEVDDLDPRREDLARVAAPVERRAGAMDRPARHVATERRSSIERPPERVDEPTEDGFAHGDSERCSGRPRA